MFGDDQVENWLIRSSMPQVRVNIFLALVLFFSMPVQAGISKQAAVFVGAEYDSNLSLNAAEQDNTSYILGGDIALSQNSARLDSQLKLSIERQFNSDAADQTRPTGFLSGRMSLVRERIFWALDSTLSQIRIDSLGASTPENTVNTYTFSTGPDWSIPFSAYTNLLLTARTESVDYDNDTRVDRNRDQASARLSHALSSRWSLVLLHTYSREVFDLGKQVLNSTTAGINHSGPRLSWSVYAGQTKAPDIGLSADVRDVSLRFRLSNTSAIFASYNLSFDSDIGSALAFTGERLDNIRFLAGECVSNLGSAGGRCAQLPDVRAEPLGDNDWRYQRDSLPNYLSEDGLIYSYLNDFSFDSALFETQSFDVGFQFQVWGQALVVVSAREEEQRESFDAASSALFAQADTITTQSFNVSLRAPISGRLNAGLAAQDRVTVLNQIANKDQSVERSLSATLNWSIVPRFFALFSVTGREYEGDESVNIRSRSSENYTVTFRYQLQ